MANSKKTPAYILLDAEGEQLARFDSEAEAIADAVNRLSRPRREWLDIFEIMGPRRSGAKAFSRRVSGSFEPIKAVTVRTEADFTMPHYYTVQLQKQVVTSRDEKSRSYTLADPVVEWKWTAPRWVMSLERAYRECPRNPGWELEPRGSSDYALARDPDDDERQVVVRCCTGAIMG